ncbi:MAG: zinc dependent phospholipase C family protein [Defluviitaleaceae bacterium]|nr:zinc dependent phospholipase C family protein [Defluviitaleaceae bacterium]
MPGFLTHYIGGQSVLEVVGPKIGSYISPASKLYNLGAQGPDIFFYYIPGFITSRIRGIGTQMHESDLGLFFMYMANIIKNSKSPAQRQIVFAYVAGFLVHYAIDVHTHGYVYSRTQDTHKMQEASKHRHFETSIDVLMLKHTHGTKPGDYKQWQLISPKKVLLRVAAASTSDAIREVYNRKTTPVDVYRAMETMAQFTRYLQSSSGRRKRWLGRAEDMTVGSRIISALVHTQEVTDNYDYLNISNNPWVAPWASQARTESFVELFDSAVADAASMIQAVYDYMHNNMTNKELTAIIMNRSLKTGLETVTPMAGATQPTQDS